MKILWIPHSSWQQGRHQRDQYFIERLAEAHEVHVGLWETCTKRIGYLNPIKHLFALRYSHRQHPIAGRSITIHHLPRVLDPWRRLGGDPARNLSLNERLFHRTIKRIVEQHGIEVLVCGPNAPLLGYPPQLPIPIVFDFVDGSTAILGDDPWWRMEEEYFRLATAVLCVSEGMLERVRTRGKRTILLPNGADLCRLRNAQGHGVRERFGLKGRKVVSLIGLTCSERPYFIRAIERIREQDPTVACLLVGDRLKARRLLAQVSDDHRDHFIYAGEVPYENIAEYFAASDVGLYPVEEEPYYHAASPIKVIEYVAAGKPVVAPRLRELARLGFPHLVLIPPTEGDFASAILSALNEPKPVAVDLDEFDWSNLASRLESFLLAVAGNQSSDSLPDSRGLSSRVASSRRLSDAGSITASSAASKRHFIRSAEVLDSDKATKES